MSKPLLAAIGILALVAAAMVAIATWTEPAPVPLPRGLARPPPQPALPPQEAPAAPVPVAPVATAGEARERPSAPGADGEEPVWRPEPAATTAPWEAVAPVNSLGALGKIGPGLRTALSTYSDEVLADCAAGRDLEPPQEEEGVVAVDEAPVLLLRLETLEGAVQIAGVTVERRGSAGQELLGCALAGLRQAVLTVPEARSGARHVLRYRLAPTSTQRPLR